MLSRNAARLTWVVRDGLLTAQKHLRPFNAREPLTDDERREKADRGFVDAALEALNDLTHLSPAELIVGGEKAQPPA